MKTVVILVASALVACACASVGSLVHAPQTAEEDSYLKLREHKTNYIAHSQNFSTNDELMPANFKDDETLFQLSLRRDIESVERDQRVSFAYTSKSFLQTSASSAPFRTTDHEPEIFYEYDLAADPIATNVTLRGGVVHQSNGEDDTRSRSWDRVYGQAIVHSPGWFDPDNSLNHPEWYVSLMPWWIFNHSNNNRDIDEYMGHFELSGSYAWGGPKWRPRLSARLRHNLRSSPRGSALIAFSIAAPWSPGFRFYLQYFNGYGESLLDYADSASRVSLGIELSRAH